MAGSSICDRYLASTLVLQGRDGLLGPYLLAINEGIDLPDLAVILAAEPDIITARLQRRGRHDRFEHDPGAARTETALFAEAAVTLTSMGVNVCHADTGTHNPRQVARQIISVLMELCANVADHG